MAAMVTGDSRDLFVAVASAAAALTGLLFVAITVTPRPAHSEFKASSSGISLRQGAHQVAQKLMTRDLSANEVIEVALPEGPPSGRDDISPAGPAPIGR